MSVVLRMKKNAVDLKNRLVSWTVLTINEALESLLMNAHEHRHDLDPFFRIIKFSELLFQIFRDLELKLLI